MLIDFNELREITIPNMNGGEGKVIAKMDVNDCGRFIQTVIPPKSSIGPLVKGLQYVMILKRF